MTPAACRPVTSVADLLKPEYRGRVALNGNPTQAAAGFNGVMMAALANGGSADDIAPGRRVLPPAQGGRQLPAGGSDAGHDRVRPDPGRDRLGVPQRRRRPPRSRASGTGSSIVPDDAVVGAFYVQAINKDAPHPAAARLWQEFLYSDEGQNIWLQGFARPVRLDAMVAAGTADQDAVANLPAAKGTPGVPDPGADREASAIPARELGAGGRVTSRASEPAAPVARDHGARRCRRAEWRHRPPAAPVARLPRPAAVRGLRHLVPAVADRDRRARRVRGARRRAHPRQPRAGRRRAPICRPS